MRYMPCGNDRGSEAPSGSAPRPPRSGLAALTYLREAVCSLGPSRVRPRRGARRLHRPRRRQTPYTSGVVGGAHAGRPDRLHRSGASAFHALLLDRAVANGYDGWMEDYGEYAPPDSVAETGSPGAAAQPLPGPLPPLGPALRRRPAAADRALHALGVDRRPLPQIVWGGDPTTGLGLRRPASSVKQALSIGLSGIAQWGSDVGGFFTLGDQRLTPELLQRGSSSERSRG